MDNAYPTKTKYSSQSFIKNNKFVDRVNIDKLSENAKASLKEIDSLFSENIINVNKK